MSKGKNSRVKTGKKIMSVDVSPFSTISLEDTKAVSLQHRIDSKFLVNRKQLTQLITILQPDYSIVEIDSLKILPYKTVYHDTADLQHYHMHHNGKLSRHKFRTREYEVSGVVFNEIKHKSNKGKTKKSRIPRDQFDETFDSTFKTFAQEKTELKNYSLIPQLYVYYNRITLVDNKFTERLTIDIDLRFQSTESDFGYENLVIVELKREEGTSNSLAIKALQEVRVLQTGFSKYCIGIASTHSNVKKNRFKHKIRRVNKICSQ